MEKIKKFLTAIGFTGSISDETTDEQLTEMAQSYLDDRATIATSGEGVKKKIDEARKEGQIVAQKQIKKKWNKELGLGLTGSEAEEMEMEEFISKAKEHVTSELETVKKNAPEEYKSKVDELQKKYNDMVEKFGSTKSEYEKKLQEAEQRYEQKEKERKTDGIIGKSLAEKKYIDNDVANDYFRAAIARDQVTIEENGSIKRADGSFVMKEDGITPIKTLAEYRDLRLQKLVVNGGAPEGQQQQQQAQGGADEMKQRQESHKRMLEKNPALAEV